MCMLSLIYKHTHKNVLLCFLQNTVIKALGHENLFLNFFKYYDLQFITNYFAL